MNKAQLAAVVSDATELTRADAARAIDAFIRTVVTAVAAGDDVMLSGFGSFRWQKRPARMGMDPRRGKPLAIPARIVPKFVAGAGFKAAVAGRRAG